MNHPMLKKTLTALALLLFVATAYLSITARLNPAPKSEAFEPMSVLPFLFLYFVATFSALSAFLYRLIKPAFEAYWVYLIAFFGLIFAYLIDYQMTKSLQVDHSKFGFVAGWVIAIPNLILILLTFFNRKKAM